MLTWFHDNTCCQGEIFVDFEWKGGNHEASKKRSNLVLHLPLNLHHYHHSFHRHHSSYICIMLSNAAVQWSRGAGVVWWSGCILLFFVNCCCYDQLCSFAAFHPRHGRVQDRRVYILRPPVAREKNEMKSWHIQHCDVITQMIDHTSHTLCSPHVSTDVAPNRSYTTNCPIYVCTVQVHH